MQTYVYKLICKHMFISLYAAAFAAAAVKRLEKLMMV